MGEAAYDFEYEHKGECQVNMEYSACETIERFHACEADWRSVVGPRGSGKSTAAVWEVCFFLPQMLYTKYGIKKTRWIVTRNTYSRLMDSTLITLFEWFGPPNFGKFYKQEKRYVINAFKPLEIEILFRACDRPEDVDKFRGAEITGYWADESCEIHQDIKNMLKSSCGRYPPAKDWPRDENGNSIVRRFGIETTNPPDIESRDYIDFYGPDPLENHVGFWQKPGENSDHLRVGYYDDLRKDMAHDPEWIERYIEGKPGVTKVGKDIYSGFSFNFHVAKERLVWPGKSFTIYRGWDNTGNTPACVAVYMPTSGCVHVLKEFWDDHSGIIDFAERVKKECNAVFPDANFIDWGDPAGEFKFSQAGGGLTCNAQMMRDIGIDVRPSSTNNIEPRIQAIATLLSGNTRGQPNMLIDPSCNRVIQGFAGGYGYREVQNGVFADKPHKNRFSHVHDALQYVGVKLVGIVKHNRKPMHKKPTHRTRSMTGYGG
jgi:hypothetical protein